MVQRRPFTPEFKRQAVQLLNAGQRPAAEIVRELGIPRNRLCKGTGGRNRALKHELARVTQERDTLKKAARVLCEGVHMRYASIRTHEGSHRLTRLCRALAVGRSGYYAWRAPVRRKMPSGYQCYGGCIRKPESSMARSTLALSARPWPTGADAIAWLGAQAGGT